MNYSRIFIGPNDPRGYIKNPEEKSIKRSFKLVNFLQLKSTRERNIFDHIQGQPFEWVNRFSEKSFHVCVGFDSVFIAVERIILREEKSHFLTV